MDLTFFLWEGGDDGQFGEGGDILNLEAKIDDVAKEVQAMGGDVCVFLGSWGGLWERVNGGVGWGGERGGVCGCGVQGVCWVVGV